MADILIFVSHSAKDEQLAAAFIHCVEACLEVPDGVIRCTSVPGYRLDPGRDGPEDLRKSLEQCAVVIGLLTPASLASSFVIMELGAAWGLRKTTCPLLAPQVNFSQIPGPLTSTHAIKIESSADIAQLMGVISKATMLGQRNSARFTAALDAFQKQVQSLPSVGPGGQASASPRFPMLRRARKLMLLQAN